MKTIDDLMLQSYFDGELSAAEAARVESLLRQDSQATALVAELRMTRDALVANEPQAKLPESVDFHWSKIAREIERQDAVAAPPRALGFAWKWLRYVSPFAAAAAVAVVLVVQSGPRESDNELYTESAPEVSPVVFQSQEESMTVIWLQGEVDSEFATPEGRF
jgi:anti-sigma factor RsiW